MLWLMWSNYFIVMIRKRKSWSGLSLVNLLGLIGMFALTVLLVKSFLISYNMLSLVVILFSMLVAGIAYVNYLTLQLRKRIKEIYVRKLLGARNRDIMLQLLIESVIMCTFLVVSGMVFAELISPWCGELLGVSLPVSSMSFLLQIVVVIILVIPIGLLAVALPIHKFIHYVNDNFSKLSHRQY